MFTLNLEHFESITVVRFHGDMALPDAVELRRQLEKILKDSKPKDVVLDLSQAGHADTSGLGALVGASTCGRVWGKRLMLYQPTNHIKRLLEQTQISGFFPMLEDAYDLKARQLNKA